MDSIQIRIDFRSNIPLCQQIVEEMRNFIQIGQLAQGTRLPTVRQVAIDLNINFNTVARAYRILDQQGYLTTRRGRGTYVSTIPSKTVLSHTPANRLMKIGKWYLREAVNMGISRQAALDILEEISAPGMDVF